MIHNKNFFRTFLGVCAIALIVGLNVRHSLNDYGVKTSKLHVEVLAQSNTGNLTGTGSGSSTVNWNHWTQWLTQGFTKDEKEWVRPCPTSTSSSASGSATVSTPGGGGSVSGSSSSSSTNPSTRSDMVCIVGEQNCTAVDC